MAVAAWATALVQVAGSSASVAVPALTFFYAWKHLGAISWDGEA
jgi:hypothetical protein